LFFFLKKKITTGKSVISVTLIGTSVSDLICNDKEINSCLEKGWDVEERSFEGKDGEREDAEKEVELSGETGVRIT